MLAAPSIADAAVRGIAIANVNMRSGPSTAYPAVAVVPVGAPVTINGCMSSVNWCDVSFVGGRGWVSGNYVKANYRSNRVYVAPNYYQGLGIPSVTFEVDNYWDRYYRDRNFYRERDRWRRYDWRSERPLPPPPPRWNDDRRPPPPRWDDDNRRPPPRWDDDRRPPPRWDDENRRPPRWDDENRRPPRWDRDEGRDQDRDDRRPPPPPRVDGDNRPPRPDRDPGRNRDERPQPPQESRDQNQNQNQDDQPRRPWGGMRSQDGGAVCTGPARDCR
ncbi:SH3 domain-containing protein [Neorhizobium lilium]|uniref:SH3 domain-containing protein n=1 Tax=Neorhizobium lilium TaxID=2503024 RepID=A0A3S4UIC1_9HYPH|nr:SH3 domain-containing protein [Neorhizobium lilium]